MLLPGLDPLVAAQAITQLRTLLPAPRSSRLHQRTRSWCIARTPAPRPGPARRTHTEDNG